MLLSDVVKLPVFANGELLGRVIDARFEVAVRDEEIVGPARLLGLVVNHNNSASYLGYERTSVRRPWLLARYLAWRHRGAFLLAWKDIDRIGHSGVQVRPGFTRQGVSLD